ncbi:MAG: TldD/PmbA family protein, partial [Gammaproteobacteria bacterium]|nr:TldD/PmbA family protein [Gammaproteobacteria bacterium]
MAIKRREFLGRIAAGAAVLSAPGFLAGCSVQQATAVAAATPENPFLDWFGVDQATAARVMSELTANGADLADLYFQHSRSNSVSFEEGSVAEASSTIQQGVGLRVVISGQTGYAYTEDLTLPSMLVAARTAATIAVGSKAVAPQSFAAKAMGELYETSVPWADIGIDQKLPILERIESKAKSLEPAVRKVSVHWSDGDERVMIATLDGNLITDYRPMTRLTLIVTARKGDEVQSGYANIAAREEFGWYTEERLTTMVQEAVDRTMNLFDARRPPAGEMPVILAAGAGGILLHEAIGHGMEADFNRNGVSSYSDMMGKKVAEPVVTVVDQATIPHERGALN